MYIIYRLYIIYIYCIDVYSASGILVHQSWGVRVIQATQALFTVPKKLSYPRDLLLIPHLVRTNHNVLSCFIHFMVPFSGSKWFTLHFFMAKNVDLPHLPTPAGHLNHRCSHTIHHAHRQGLRTLDQERYGWHWKVEEKSAPTNFKSSQTGCKMRKGKLQNTRFSW